MNQFADAKTLFTDDFDMSGYLNSFTFEAAKTELIQALNSSDSPVIFLLGDPGVGKSFLLRFIQESMTRIKIIKSFPSPHFDERELLEILLQTTGESVVHRSLSIHELLENLKKHYKNLEHVVFIDEAQLLTEKQLEFIRVIGDMRLFKFVLSMHKNEGNFVLAKPHFKSRNAKAITLEHLSRQELQHYIQNRLLSHNLSDVASAIGEKEVKFIHKHAKANFRASKKLLKSLFEIIEIARRGKIQQYSNIADNTLTMAAIDAGVIHVK